MADERTFRPIRRVVAAHEDHRSVVRSDGTATNYRDTGGRRSTLVWATDRVPAPFLTEDDAGAWQLRTSPPVGGTRFCVIESAPGATYPALHRTDTIDYVVCIAGTITMDLDEGAVELGPGDVLVQLGTNHGWRNEGTEPALVAFVLVDAFPKRDPSLPEPRP